MPTERGERPLDRASTLVPAVGRLAETGAELEPFRLLDPVGDVVETAAEFFRDLQAMGRSTATLRSYGMDLLRWFRFLWAIEVAWDRTSAVEAREFARWLQLNGRPASSRDGEPAVVRPYSVSVRAHSETVLRGFYDFHLSAGSGPLLNPFPLDRSRLGRRAHAHGNPMEPFRNERTGRYRPAVPSRIPRAIPDSEFNEIFALLPSHRDRALVAFYVSTGPRSCCR